MSQRSYPTVLIVEDEPLIRFYESELAEGAGFLTLQAEDAERALEELEGPLEIHILLTDVNMPGSMDGLDLASLVHRRWPDMKIVIVSGRPDGRAAEQLEDAIFVAKPFTPNQLISALLKAVSPPGLAEGDVGSDASEGPDRTTS